jgi:hypothetical protein
MQWSPFALLSVLTLAHALTDGPAHVSQASADKVFASQDSKPCFCCDKNAGRVCESLPKGGGDTCDSTVVTGPTRYHYLYDEDGNAEYYVRTVMTGTKCEIDSEIEDGATCIFAPRGNPTQGPFDDVCRKCGKSKGQSTCDTSDRGKCMPLKGGSCTTRSQMSKSIVTGETEWYFDPYEGWIELEVLQRIQTYQCRCFDAAITGYMSLTLKQCPTGTAQCTD